MRDMMERIQLHDWSMLHNAGSARSALACESAWKASLEDWIGELRSKPASERPRFHTRGAEALELLIHPERPHLAHDEVCELYAFLQDALWSCCLREGDSWKGREKYPRKRREVWATRAIALRLFLTARELEEIR